jgi:hypothetical protein
MFGVVIGFAERYHPGADQLRQRPAVDAEVSRVPEEGS